MIKGFIILSKNHTPRIVKYFDGRDRVEQHNTTKEISKSIQNKYHITNSGFVELNSDRLIYRIYSNLAFIFLTDYNEPVLGILDLIRAIVFGLDICFEDVCELDIIYNFYKIFYLLDEIVIGCILFKPTFDEIVKSIKKIKEHSDSWNLISEF